MDIVFLFLMVVRIDLGVFYLGFSYDLLVVLIVVVFGSISWIYW